MIPEQFKQNITLQIEVFGFPVKVNYAYYWPFGKEATLPDEQEPLVSHMEFISDHPVISNTGYRSHFFFTKLLEETDFKNITELVTHVGELLSRDSGYEPPAPNRQLRLF